MNFTPFETIDEVIKSGCVFWSVYDNTGKRLIYENNNDLSTEESAELLKRVLGREMGEYCQIRLSARKSAERGNGGSTKTFGPYYYRLTNVAPGGFPAAIGAPSQGVSIAEYIAAINEINAEKMKRQQMELTQREPGIIERLATEENVNKLLGIFDKLATSRKQPLSISGPASEDKELSEAVNTLIGFDQGREALINIAAAGPMVWAVIRTGLRDNQLIS